MKRRQQNHPHVFFEIELKTLLTSTQPEGDKASTTASKLSADPSFETGK
jgi:hypothetical protein